MGEIKSTLDLVMERTRNLSMTEEEKAQQRRSEFDKRLQGLLNKYGEGALPLENLTARIEALKAELKIIDPNAVLQAVYMQIDPEGENGCWLNLLGILKPPAAESLEKILEDYRRQRIVLIETCELQMKSRLADRYGITGSAVVHNPLKDREYQKHIAVLRDEIRSQVEACSGTGVSSTG
jgi:hypothetical protein